MEFNMVLIIIQLENLCSYFKYDCYKKNYDVLLQHLYIGLRECTRLFAMAQ